MVRTSSAIVVSRDPWTRSVVESVLRDWGLLVHHIPGIGQLRALLAQQPTRLVLLGCEGSPVDTSTLVRARTALGSGIPLVVMLRHYDGDAAVEALLAGADDVLGTPFEPETIASRLSRFVHGTRALSAVTPQAQQLPAVHEIVFDIFRALRAAPSIADALGAALSRLCRLAPCHGSALMLLESPDMLRVVVSSGPQLTRGAVVHPSQHPALRPLFASEPSSSKHSATFMAPGAAARQGSPRRSVGLLPIRDKGPTLGLLMALSLEVPIEMRRSWEERAQAIAQSIAVVLPPSDSPRSPFSTLVPPSPAHGTELDPARSIDCEPLFDSVPSPLLAVSPHWNVLYVNDAMAKLMGRSRREVAHRPLASFLDEATSLMPWKLAQDPTLLLGPGRPSRITRIRRPDGTTLRVEVRFRGNLPQGGAVFHCQPEHEARGHGLPPSKIPWFVAQVLHVVARPVIAIDRTEVVRIFNHEAEQLFGLPRDHVVGSTRLSDLLAADQATMLLSFMISSGSADARLDMVGRKASKETGSVREEELPPFSARIVREGNEPVGMVLVFESQDDTASRQDESSAQQRRSLLMQLAGAAAHELNQPLTSIMGYAEKLKRMGKLDDRSLAWIEIILSESERMASTVQKIGGLTRWQTKEYLGKTKIIDLEHSSGRTPSDVPDSR